MTDMESSGDPEVPSVVDNDYDVGYDMQWDEWVEWGVPRLKESNSLGEGFDPWDEWAEWGDPPVKGVDEP